MLGVHGYVEGRERGKAMMAGIFARPYHLLKKYHCNCLYFFNFIIAGVASLSSL